MNQGRKQAARAAKVAKSKQTLSERLRECAESSWSHSSTAPFKALMLEAAEALDSRVEGH